MPAPLIRATQRLVREYTSYRAFSQDAQLLYARSHYTVEDTNGLAHRGLMDALRFFKREFSLPPRQHLVITYVSPTSPRDEDRDPTERDSSGLRSSAADSPVRLSLHLRGTGRLAAAVRWLSKRLAPAS